MSANESFLEEEVGTYRDAMKLPLKDGGLLDRFYQPGFPQILQQCQWFLDHKGNEAHVPRGSNEGSGYRVNPQEYQVTNRQVNEEFMLHHRGKGLWKSRGARAVNSDSE